MAFQAPRGTEDLIGQRARAWREFTACAERTFSLYGYEFAATPIFERHDLFARSAGEGTDIMRKEIFAVRSMGAMDALARGEQLKADQQLALRPEGTAGIVRAIAQHSLVAPGGAPAKLWYAGPMFRCERPQKGRLRQFHQVGVECLGADSAAADAEAIIMCMRFFEELGIPRASMRLLVNSMGDEECRGPYTEKVRAYMHEHDAELCEECRRRAEENPLRSFDCKNEGCKQVMAGAPRFADNLCTSCRERFDELCALLDAAGLSYEVDERLVRGFDYYTGTVFEVEAREGTGAQSAIGGGGRYDKLMEEVGGRPTPGFGFALGYERCALAIQAAGGQFPAAKRCDLFAACVDDSVRAEAFGLVQACRDAGIAAEMDHQHRSLKSQFKLADKLGAMLVAVLGPDELAQGMVKVRNMNSHQERLVEVAKVKALLAKFGGAPFEGEVLSAEDVFGSGE